MAWSCRDGLSSLHPALVYPLLGLLIGGFLIWGEMSGKKHVPVEDDGETVLPPSASPVTVRSGGGLPWACAPCCLPLAPGARSCALPGSSV